MFITSRDISEGQSSAISSELIKFCGDGVDSKIIDEKVLFTFRNVLLGQSGEMVRVRIHK